MRERDREFGEFLRSSLRAAAESVAPGEDGLIRIRMRLTAGRPLEIADHGEPPLWWRQEQDGPRSARLR